MRPWRFSAVSPSRRGMTARHSAGCSRLEWSGTLTSQVSGHQWVRKFVTPSRTPVGRGPFVYISNRSSIADSTDIVLEGGAGKITLRDPQTAHVLRPRIPG